MTSESLFDYISCKKVICHCLANQSSNYREPTWFWIGPWACLSRSCYGLGRIYTRNSSLIRLRGKLYSCILHWMRDSCHATPEATWVITCRLMHLPLRLKQGLMTALLNLQRRKQLQSFSNAFGT